jgi:uncharacterized protein (DUF2252 family)
VSLPEFARRNRQLNVPLQPATLPGHPGKKWLDHWDHAIGGRQVTTESGKKAQQTATEVQAELHDNTMTPRDDRRESGMAMAEKSALPRELHAAWNPPADRPDPVEVLQKSDEGRIPELIPIRYGRMLQTPFTFYRGAAALMASDLSYTPNTKVRVQACGDCHLLNFGGFATPERNISFDMNDFDETLPAPWEWDVKRLAVSYVLLCRDNGLKPKAGKAAAKAVAKSYREKIKAYSAMTILNLWYSRIDWHTILDITGDPGVIKRTKDRTTKEMKRTIEDYYFPKLVEESEGRYTIRDNPPLIYHMSQAERLKFDQGILKAFQLYRESLQEDKRRLLDRYSLRDLALKVVGVGSVGTVCALALMLARDDEPLFLQIKEARPSVLEAYAGKSVFENHGQRVVEGQRIIQSASDIFLGWTQMDNGKHFYLRQLRDIKIKLQPEYWDADMIVSSGKVMADVLARAHARSGDSAFISGYLGDSEEFEEAIAEFSVAYADQTEKDYETLMAAVKSGRIQATME